LYKRILVAVDDSKMAEGALREALALAKAHAAQVRQRVSRVIVDDATRWHADLLVVGTHGRHGIEHLLLGSVAEGVARTAPGSVLLVRAH
jgi:nucleotide-binding universal stress UspA family protein